MLVKINQDKEPSSLEVISETNPNEGLRTSLPRPVNSPPVAARKTSVVTLRGKPSNEILPAVAAVHNSPPVAARKTSVVSLRGKHSNETLPSGGAVQHRDVSASNHPAIRETRARPRPISVSGIPSPTPTRNSPMHTRKDRYDALLGDGHHRTASVRSVSTKMETKVDLEKKTHTGNTRTIVPPRDSSKRITQDPPPARKQITPSISSRDLSTHKRQSSKDNTSSIPHPKPKTLKPQPSKDLVPPPPREHISTPLKNKRSKELSSPTPSSQNSSPKPKSKLTSSLSSHTPTEPPPEQTRLLQLLHLIPLSENSLTTYESSAHNTLSTRYTSLQTRFQNLQKYDHAKTLTETLTTLKSWSDGNIRSLSNLLIDWESLTTDLRTFCKRLQNTLKPINKSLLEEKGNNTSPAV